MIRSKLNFIIYLDMDGVLTSEDYIVKMHESFITDKFDPSFYYRNFMHQWCFQEEAVKCLNKLYDLMEYRIVISSTRRFELDRDSWNTVFRINNIKADVLGTTNKLKQYTNDRYNWRADEIKDYQSRINLPFIIIDDDNFDLLEYEDKLIHVSTEKGLTEDYLQEMVDKLKKQGVDI